MMYMIEGDRLGEFAREIAEMHRLRFRVFKERLNWDVTVSGDMEIDEYDALSPIYLVHCDDRGRVGGCARLLPTTGPNMLRNSFPALLGRNPPPEHPRIWEASRLSVEVEPASATTRAGSSLAALELFTALIEFGLKRNLTEIVAVTDARLVRIFRRVGASWRSLGEPQRIGNATAVAGFIDVSVQLLQHLRMLGGFRAALLDEPLELKESA